MENKVLDTDRDNLKKKLYCEVAKCVWRWGLGSFTWAVNQSIYHLGRNSGKIKSIQVSKHTGQPLWYLTFICNDRHCLMSSISTMINNCNRCT